MKNNLLIIARAARLLAKLRAPINVWKDKSQEGEHYEHNNVVTEKPDRISQLFYNLCRGHALICGRVQINQEDIKLIVELAIDSAPPIRAKLFRKLLEKEGKMLTTQVEVVLECSKPTALKEMETLKLLGLAYITTDNPKGFGEPEKIINLNQEFDWFLSEECKKIRGLPLPERQCTLSDLANY